LTIPTIILGIRCPAPINWLLPLSALITPYCIGAGFLPTGIGWSAPLLFALTAWVSPILPEQSYDKGLIALAKVLPSLSQLLLGLGVGTVALILSSWLGFALLKQQLSLGRNWLVLGSAGGALIGAWLATNNLFISSLLAELVGFSIFMQINDTKDDSDAGSLAIGVAVGVAVGIAGSLAASLVGDVVGGLAVGVVLCVAAVIAVVIADGVMVYVAVCVMFYAAFYVTFFVASVSRLSLSFYLITCAILALGFSPSKKHSWALSLTLTMLLLRVENLHASVLWAIPTILLGYYRIFPDYLLSAIPPLLHIAPSTLQTWPNRRRPQRNPLSLVRTLPRLNSELIWLPIPHHDTILAAAFQQSPADALAIYQNLQTDSLPGAQITLRKALPQIIANLLKAPRSTADLLLAQANDHPYLPFLIPEFYQPSNDDETNRALRDEKRNKEVAIIVPRLQSLITDIANTLDTPSASLRERGLENIQIKLTQLQLQLQLPSLGIPPKSVPRWQSVLTQWQTLLDLEMLEQRKLSQGELLSPFQYGNPLKPRDTFKGRRTLADRLYRLILDRNRPTLVLHGPRRFGKTSFLNNLPRRLPTDLIPIYLDLQSSALNNSEADFCYGLVRAIFKDTRSQNLALPTVPTRDSFKSNPYATLEDWLDQALPLLPAGRRLLLNLDEFEKIGTAISDGKLSLNLLNELRHLIQHRDELAFMFSGVQTLDELGPNWSSYFISVVPIEMLYLEPHEAEDLLRNPDPDFKMQYEAGLVETIIHLTHCQPYLLQLIGACLVEQANRAQVKTATHRL
jgi:AAA domain